MMNHITEKWETIALIIHELRRPSLYHQAFDNSLISQLEVIKVLRELKDQKVKRLRVFENGFASKINEEFLYLNPPNSHESLEAWGTRIFGDSKFGIIINFAHDSQSFLKSKRRIFSQLKA